MSRPVMPVMIVDDDFDVRTMLAESLEEAGYPVETTSNGQEALVRLREQARAAAKRCDDNRDAWRPGLILLDLMMPVMDGWELKQELRGDPTLRTIPVVMMTASRNLGQLDGDVLLKPFPLDALLATVEKHCGTTPA